MSLNIKDPEGYAIAECREIKVSGLPGVGGYMLCIALRFDVNHRGTDTFLQHVSLRVEGGDHSQRLIGVAIPEGAQPLGIPKYGSMTLYFRLFVSANQVEAIEALRCGGGFDLGLWLYAEVTQPNGSTSLSEYSAFPVKQSDWLDVIKNMGFTNSIIYEFPLDKALDDSPVLSYIEKARKYLHQGEYDLCVGECRKIFELHPLDSSSQTILGSVRTKYSDRQLRENMDVKERWVLLRDVLMLLTHPPHHSAQSDSYSRDQAKMIFTATISYCSV